MFPHHEAEIFQSECCLNHDPVVQYWIHNGMINVNGEKMSKSLGNFWTIRDAISKVEPLELRYCLINAPYRQPVEFNDVMLQDSSSHYQKLLLTYGEGLSKYGKKEWHNSEFLKNSGLNFSNGMDDDFNTAIAVATLFDLIRYINKFIDSESLEKKTTDSDLETLTQLMLLMRELTSNLGLFLTPPVQVAAGTDGKLLDLSLIHI